MKDTKKKVKNILGLLIMLIAMIALIVVYSKYNYNDFVKSVKAKDRTEFTRDSKIKSSKVDSYKIENQDYNDAMFYETIDVIPNMPYKVTCRVKTENVENENNTKSGGAHICIAQTTERSKTINGTQDWQELTFLFNSKDRKQLDIGFRLGGYEENSKGIAWFSDFKIEMGHLTSGNVWKVGCFIFPKIDVDVEVNGKTQHVSLEMTQNDIQDIKNNIQRFQTSIESMSNNKMKVEYDLHTITEPIKTLSYDKTNGYYVSDADVFDLINDYVEKNEYDHIYVGIRMADMQKGNSILVNDWIGLGGMDYLGIGYSNIRLPDDESNYAYKYNYRFNTFPEEVFIHEFLHTLERNSKEYGYEVPALHDYAKFGYSEDKLEGLKKWYQDYMNQEVDYNGTKVGIPAQVYNYRPVHESNFKYATQVKALQEPQNIIEVIRSLFGRVGRIFQYKASDIE